MINVALLQLLYMGVSVVIIDVVNQSTAVKCHQSQTDVSGCRLAMLVSVTRCSATDRLHYLPTVAPPPLSFCFFIEIKPFSSVGQSRAPDEINSLRSYWLL